ncbi:Nif3-like dinuclear metal center hexameric protein [Adlercreutzia sp. ZJ154]|uniref:Nif3-like dinuclear metal center hexameric protein n=1 Tax=Adlercreutzia sp. ZJ154 TaxID=2709790 RepID=UPI0013EBB6A8|nr:Nif3-like dinuclear metal center hexameric protein [Adlercreutzia sp. ZJ154]
MAKSTTTEAIQKRKTPLPAKQAKRVTVASLEAALLKEFPDVDAESWDTTGIYVGEGAIPVTKVAVALDPTVPAILQAASCSAQVLVTHHPAYIEAPATFAPEVSCAISPGAAVYAAARNGVALMCFHTALDVSNKAQKALPAMLNLDYKGKVLQPIATSKRKGYGQICTVLKQDGKAVTLGQLGARCTSVFGRAPRIWGDFNTGVETVVTACGSASNIVEACVKANVQCLICGELKYHDALALSQAGVAVIELGHDLSELPLVAVLADSVAHAGISRDSILIVDQSSNWAYPEAIRL